MRPLSTRAAHALLVCAALGFAPAVRPAAAHEYAAGALKIVHPWSRATPNGAKVAGGYVTVTNAGTEADTLTGASFEAAGRAEIHRMSVEGGVMRMAPVEGGLTVKPGETVVLKPGGYHLMFLDLKAPLRQGGTVKGALTFTRAGTVPVEFAVEAIAAQGPDGGGRHAH